MLYVFCMGSPEAPIDIGALGRSSQYAMGEILRVELVGSGRDLNCIQSAEALTVQPPLDRVSSHALAFRVTGAIR